MYTFKYKGFCPFVKIECLNWSFRLATSIFVSPEEILPHPNAVLRKQARKRMNRTLEFAESL